MEPEFQNFNELCFSVFYIFVIKKREKTFIILIQSILFSNGGLLHREKKFLFREIKILGGGFLNFIEVCHNEFCFLLRGHHKFL